jgi:hypothetical protein
VIRNGVVVQDAETGAYGLVIDAVGGGAPVRVQWFPNGRTIKTDRARLRYAFPDEWAYRRAVKK